MLGDNFAGAQPGYKSLHYFAPKVIYGETIADAHRLALYDLVWNRRTTQTITEDGEKIIESGPRTYVIENITKNRYLDFLPFTKKFLDEYTDKFLNGYLCVNNFEYDYHSRLYHYHHAQADDINQVAEIQEKLIRNLNTRRAVAITWKPEVDNITKDVPCLQYIQCRIIDDILHMNVLFRSNDMLSAFGSNAYALTTLQRNITDYISRTINKKLGYGFYNHTAISPHLYYERDAAEFEKVLNCLHSEGLL